MFKLKLIPSIKLQSITLDNGHRSYEIPDFGWVSSVTTKLAELSDNSALIKWKERIGEEESNRISNKAKIRGTAIHKIAESYLLNEPNWKDKCINPFINIFFFMLIFHF